MKDETVGLARGVVKLLAYRESWPERFRQEASRLSDALGDHIGSVEHMGSTAVPGLAAKPIIDFMASVKDFASAREFIPDVEAL